MNELPNIMCLNNHLFCVCYIQNGCYIIRYIQTNISNIEKINKYSTLCCYFRKDNKPATLLKRNTCSFYSFILRQRLNVISVVKISLAHPSTLSQLSFIDILCFKTFFDNNFYDFFEPQQVYQ